MGGGLAESTRKWYCENIKRILKKHGKASIGTIIAEMRKIPQNKYPIQEERIVNLLKYLRALGEVTYHKSAKKKIPSKWGVKA